MYVAGTSNIYGYGGCSRRISTMLATITPELNQEPRKPRKYEIFVNVDIGGGECLRRVECMLINNVKRDREMHEAYLYGL